MPLNILDFKGDGCLHMRLDVKNDVRVNWV
jgi:hypothetical protein